MPVPPRGVSLFAAAAVGRFPLPACPRAPLSPRSKSAAFAYSEQVGAHMPKMHQTKLATIIIINCAVVLGEGRGWQTSLIIMKLSMCAAVLQQLCLAQQAGNDACYNNPQSPARPPVVRSREGCAAPEVPSRSSPCCSWEGDTRTVWGGGQTLFCCPFPVPCVRPALGKLLCGLVVSSRKLPLALRVPCPSWCAQLHPDFHLEKPTV